MRLRSSSSSAPKAATSWRESGLLRDDVIDIASIDARASEIEGHVRHRHRNAQADVLVGFGGDRAVEQVLHRAALLAAGAAVADAHAAPAPRSESGGLRLHQQGDAGIATNVRERAREAQDDLGGVRGGYHGRREGLAARGLRIASVLPEGVDGIEQATRAAYQRATFDRVRRDAVEVLARETSRQFARERRHGGDAEVEVQVRMTLPEA